jgi:hypothetical protein
MTKRHVTVIQQSYREVLSDISDWLPETASGLDRDYKRLCSAIEEHGLRFSTIDLVDFGKHFDLCLSKSRLTLTGLPHMRPHKKGSVIPRLFKGLLIRIFDDSGCLLPVPCISSIRFCRQLYYLAKKLRMECEKERTNETVRSFYSTDARVLSATLEWDADHLDGGRAFHLDFDDKLRPRSSDCRQLSLEFGEDTPWLPRDCVRAIHFASDTVTVSLGHYDPFEWGSRHGPGAVSDRLGESKYDFPTWPEKLSRHFPLADFAYANYALWASECQDQDRRFSEVESPSKLIAVPKTQKAPRLIASEPTAHQWCQQVVLDYLASRSNECWIGKVIHLRDQTFNQQLARTASMTGSHWTIDLSEASDRVSCYVVERVFRKNPYLLEAFHACRTRTILNKICPDQPRLHKLRKFTTMGSALTFPVQSLVFLSVILGCMLSHRKLEYTMKNVRKLSKEVLVFGDDLIVPSDVGHLVLGALRYLGFKVNLNKTFGTGRFRESCGGEYFDGHDVTPSYLLTYPDRRRPESLDSCVQTRNNFYRKGYFRMAQYLKSTVERDSYLRIPTLADGSGLFGWISYEGKDLSGLRSRFNKHLHRREVLAHVLTSRVTRRSDRMSSRVLQYFTEAPAPDQKWSSGVLGRPSLNIKRRWVPVE